MKLYYTLLVVLCLPIVASAQTRVVSGRVTDKLQNPIPDVQVYIKNSNLSAETNQDGYYRIETKEGDNVLVFKKVNMKVVEVKISSDVINVTLTSLDDLDLFELSLEDLMNIEVVSSSKVKQSQSEAPNIINAFSSEFISTFDWLHPQDIILSQPGFFYSQDYDRRTIGFRGMFEGWNNNHILMLVDGVPFNDNLYGTAYTWDNTPLNFVKTVEIIRGPGGALYGTNAMNGVFTMNTLKASDFNGIGQLRMRGGSNNYRYLDFITGAENDNYGMVVAFNYNGTLGNEYDSYDASGLSDQNGNLLKFKTNDSRENTYFYSKVYGKERFEGLTLQYHEQHWDFETGHGWLFIIPDRPENMKENRRIIALRYAPDDNFKNFNYDITARYQIHSIDWQMRYYNDGALGNYYPYGVSEYLKTNAKDLFLRAQMSYKAGEHNFLAGVENTMFYYNGDKAHYSNIDMNLWTDPDSATVYVPLNPWLEFVKNKPVNNIAGFAQYMSPKFFNRIQMTLSGRYDKMFFEYIDLMISNELKTKSFEMFTPRCGLVFTLSEKLFVKTILGKAFRTPSPTEMFGFNTFTLASNLSGLKPEVLTNFDLGLIWEPTTNFGLRTNTFWLNFENQIAYSVANENLSTNVYSQQAAGVELESHFSIDKFSGFANLTLVKRLDEKIKDTTITASPDNITWAPATTVNFGIYYRTQKFTASVYGTYHGKMLRRESDVYPGMTQYRPEKEVKGWFLANLKFDYSVSRKIDLAISIKNLLNSERYFIKNNPYPFDYRLEGRQFFAEVVFRL